MHKLKSEGGSRRRIKGAAVTGAELRALRIKAGLSLVALAKLAGYHAVYIGSMERGEVRINERALRILKSALELS